MVIVLKDSKGCFWGDHNLGVSSSSHYEWILKMDLHVVCDDRIKRIVLNTVWYIMTPTSTWYGTRYCMYWYWYYGIVLFHHLCLELSEPIKLLLSIFLAQVPNQNNFKSLIKSVSSSPSVDTKIIFRYLRFSYQQEEGDDSDSFRGQ